MTAERVARRLALLADVRLDADDRASVEAEFEDFDRVLPELAAFAAEMPWPAVPMQPYPRERSRRAPAADGQAAAAARNVPADPHSTNDPCALGIGVARRLLDARELSSLELVDAALRRLEATEPTLNAFITVLGDAVRTAARQADAEIARGERRGPLHGIPVTIKDMFDTAGVRTTGASKILADWVPEADSALVASLKDAGAILVGKTNQDEFGHGGTSTLSYYGPVHNPWEPSRVAGGSSGGSAAAVAVGIGPLSYGTETGSSVRRPAAYCGIVGLRPTLGLLSRHGSFRGAWTMDQVGTFARSVADAACGVGVAAGYDARDPASAQASAGAYGAAIPEGLRGVRLGVLRKFVTDAIDPSIRAAFERALGEFAALGAEIVEIEVPEIRYAAMTSMLTSAAEAGANNVTWLHEQPQNYVTEVRRRLAAGLGITAAEYLTVQRARQRIAVAVRVAFDTVDAIVAPTTARLAPPIVEGPRGNGDVTFEAGYQQSNLLRLPSMLGLPAASVPCGAGADDLPIGLQIIGAWFDDAAVLQVAAAYQQGTAWSARWPALAGAQ
jgi:aspartyl-tRNA(Asn)/glutamyl-tRNA(Gln) amidotransferase subunit A